MTFASTSQCVKQNSNIEVSDQFQGCQGCSAKLVPHLSAMASQKGRRAARGADPGTAPMPPDLAKQKVSRKKTSMAASDRYDSSTMARKVSTPTARNCATAALSESASRMAAMLWHRGQHAHLQTGPWS